MKLYKCLLGIALLIATSVASADGIMSAGRGHVCALKTDNTVACWGSNDQGRSTPPAGEFIYLTSGAYHTCGLRQNGAVVCWGYDASGQASPPPGTYKHVSAGSEHTCAVKTDGSAVCWGLNNYGQAAAPTGVFSQVAAGYWHTCGLHTDGTVACWGSAHSVVSGAPTDVTFSEIQSGAFYTCGYQSDNSVRCWGAYGSLGYYAQLDPVAYDNDLCALKFDGTVTCWNGITAPDSSQTFNWLTTGYQFACGIRSDSSIACWGSNDYGKATPPTEFKFKQPGAIPTVVPGCSNDDLATTYATGYAAGYDIGFIDGKASLSKLINISARAAVSGGAYDVFGGFAITGSGTKKILVRGIAVDPGVNPTILVLNSATKAQVGSNDEWELASNAAEMRALPAQYKLPDRNGNDAALLLALPAGTYDVVLSSTGASGLTVVGVDAIE